MILCIIKKIEMNDETRALRETLGRKGHRTTNPRIMVLKAILGSGDHFTAEEVYARLSQVGRATVYRTIKLLVSLGMVCKVVLEDGTHRYRLSRLIHHHHLLCASCSAVEDFARCAIDDVIPRVESVTRYQILGHRIELYGFCEACLVKAGEAAPTRGS